MVANPIFTTPSDHQEQVTTQQMSWEEFILHPPERMEWVDGQLIEKTGMTLKHGSTQATLAFYWKNYLITGGQGGIVCTETLCRTNKQGRRPDVAYITPEFLEQYGTNFTIFPQSFSLIAEIVSPDDSGEELFAKAKEYLESGCQEVWLLFPEAEIILVNAGQRWVLFNADEVVSNQTVLTEFKVTVKELFSYSMKKLFIVLEGIDGSGTSTQASLLKDYFIQKGEKAVISPEPTNRVIGKLIREAMQKQVFFFEDKQKFDEQMAYLFAADRHDHLYNDVDGVFKLIGQEECHVITTRYYFSSLAYNCYTSEEFNFVRQLNQRFPEPDLVIYIELPVEVSLERLQARKIIDVYENQEKLIQVRNNYQQIFDNYKGLLLKIDGKEDINIVHDQIIQFIETKFN